jgi:hypothetical protein
MKNKLFDFSPAVAVMTVTAYALLLFLFGFTAANARRPALFVVVFVLLAASFLLVLIYFLMFPAVLGEKAVTRGRRRIKRANLLYRLEYSRRFKEAVILFQDKKINYARLDKKEAARHTITVQATRANVKKLSANLGVDLSVPRRPRRQRRPR